jgi:hypothetical protein
MTQFLLTINDTTTGHKLQGESMDALGIEEWSKVKNWAYLLSQGSARLLVFS